MQDAAVMMRDLDNERITPEEEQAWMTWWMQHPEHVKQLTALREEVSALLKDAQVLATKAARIRNSNSQRLRLSPSSFLEGAGRVDSEGRLVLDAILAVPRAPTH